MTLDQLQARLGHVFADARLLQEALTHRSFGQPNNERFEFLGDSILNCVIAIALFERFGELREGELSRVRASLVRQDALHRIALDLDLGDCLRLGEGELKSGGSRRPSILADAVEALFAAVFLDAGFAAAKAVVDRLYVPLLAEVDPLKPSKDPKTALQEWLQGRRIPVPTYSMVQVIGEAHAQEFEVACEIPKLGVRTLGRGPSRRIAEQQSAELALAAVRKK
ncbi:MAG: ribonuclease III [Thauera sp.]|jgi:ribonuclease III|nr:ribonuclease III [Thauera sp.]MBP7467504.1 ribonuclease III [Thauera sp.]MBP8217772.1 ribonuclease III [Thauera sp.]MBP8923351.1 ribonuclease III [Thauera sp.]HQV07594.1 ribonuclease III [Thauera sp.]